MTALEKIHSEISERFKDLPDKNLIIGFTMGVIEKHKAEMINENINKIVNTFTNLEEAGELEDAKRISSYHSNEPKEDFR